MDPREVGRERMG